MSVGVNYVLLCLKSLGRSWKEDREKLNLALVLISVRGSSRQQTLTSLMWVLFFFLIIPGDKGDRTVCLPVVGEKSWEWF